MKSYIPFTYEEMYIANNMDLVRFLEARGEQFERSGFEKRMKSNPSVTIRGNMWFDHSNQDGGYPIEFLKKYRNLGFQEAVCTLLDRTMESLQEQRGKSPINQSGNHENKGHQLQNRGQEQRNKGNQQRNQGQEQQNRGQDQANQSQQNQNCSQEQRNQSQQQQNRGQDQRNQSQQQQRNQSQQQRNQSQQQQNRGQEQRNQSQQQQNQGHQQQIQGIQNHQQRNQNYDKPPFQLPNQFGDMRRTFAYLTKGRKIDYEVIQHFAKEKTLYQSCEQFENMKYPIHNCVFVGKDENNAPRHAHKHGLNSEGPSFKRNVMSSDAPYSFHHIGTNDTLFVFEAPIDMLSFICMFKDDWKESSYVSLCGTSGSAIQWMTTQIPDLKHIGLCLDNDDAGKRAIDSFHKEYTALGYNPGIILPSNKDWNEDLIEERMNEQNFQQGGMTQNNYVLGMG